MMDIFESLFLGLIQGLTEFLPVSSSGHLAIVQYFMGLSENIVSFDIILHLGTLLSILIFFRKRLIVLIKSFIDGIDSRLRVRGNDTNKIPYEFWLVLVGSIPAVILGFLFKDLIGGFFTNIKLVGVNLIITSILLFLASRVKKLKYNLKNLGLNKALLIGAFQAIAILPGVSRSGATISGATLSGLKREDGFYFSFLLAIPAILGAVILDLPNILEIERKQFGIYLAGFVVSFVVGLIALKIFEKIFLKNKLIYFSIYCLMLGMLVVFVI